VGDLHSDLDIYTDSIVQWSQLMPQDICVGCLFRGDKMKTYLNQVVRLLLVLMVLAVPVALVSAQGDETVSVTSFRALLHTEPTAQSETIARLPRGALLTFVAFDEGKTWVQVETEDGVSGWISLAHVYLNGPYTPPADGLTRIALDGQADDWANFVRPYVDEAGDATGDVDLQAVRSFMNDTYLYVLVEVAGATVDVDLLLVDIVTNTNGVYAAYQYALPGRRAGTLFAITDEGPQARDASGVEVVRGDAFELRIPLDLIDTPLALNLVAVSVQADGEADELAAVMPAVVTREVEPSIDGTIPQYRVNLRAAPVNGRVLEVLIPGVEFSLIGRTADAAWVQVRLPEAVVGWVSAEYVATEVDLMSLAAAE
jgi:hypothetical protein